MRIRASVLNNNSKGITEQFVKILIQKIQSSTGREATSRQHDDDRGSKIYLVVT
ncbi:hypothetical protein [uncultured Methanospirillum sp.]|uniref:hypothetical protein n=1 Tax=uncultured Methanospirillum sp. TaxID=262503 RepID=UPI0029C65B18|nr:hypothetical protein [uncultured Methanospirillum sp.]